MELKIYNQSGALKLTVSTSSSSTWNQEMMREDAVSASFTHPFYVPLDVNDYVMLEGVKFSIKKEYKPKQKNMQTYSYNVKFYAPIHDAEQVMYLNLTDGQYDVQFSLDGSPREHLKKWVDNMNRIYGREVWSMGDVVISANQTIEYNNLTCWDALTSIAEAFETEWWADGFTMNLTRCERGDRVELGYLKGLTSLTQSENSDDVKFFTRLIPLGSTKNIDASRYGFSRLQLPDKAKYVDRNTQYGLYEHVEEAAFAGIFPHYTGSVSEVRAEEKTGDDKKPFTVYYFKDSGMAFDPCENEIGGLVKHVSFQTGDLAGRDFEANYISETKEWEIINTYPDEEIQIPGGNLIPRVGDTYIPWNFRMPTEYEVQAELDYKAAVDDFLKKYSDDIAIYGGETDYIHIDKNSVPLVVGQNVRLLSAEYFGEVGYRDSRMTKVVRKLDNLSIATIQCTNQVGKGWKSQVDSSISQLKYVIAEQQEQTVLDVMKSWDGRPATDYRVMSALRVLKEITERALSKTGPDQTKYLVSFLAGAVFGKDGFAPGLTGFGARINEKGYGEMRGLRLWEWLEVPEIRYNRVEVYTGIKWRTPGAGIIQSVEIDTGTDGNALPSGTVHLKLEDGEIGAVSLDDISMGIIHYGDASLNATADSDDNKGNFHFAGFGTSYWRITSVTGSNNKSFRYALRPGTYLHPQPYMHFSCYGNFTNKERQTSVYETRTYTRMLWKQNTWEISAANIAMQYGNMDNLLMHGMQMEGYSMYLNNVYFTGRIQQVKPDGTPIHTANDRGEWMPGKYDFYDRVSHNGSIWLCVNEDGTTTEPVRGNPDWLEQVIKGQDGMDGVPGPAGADGKSYYTWIRYADDSLGNGISNSPVGKAYIGFAYNKETAVESSDPRDYKWSDIKGEAGVPGAPGADGKPTYTWIAYSDNANGSGMYQQPNDKTQYIGIAVNKNTATEGTNPADYTWSKFKGEQGYSISNAGDWHTGLIVPYLGITRMGGKAWMCKVKAGTTNPPMWTVTDKNGNRILQTQDGGKTYGYILTGEENTEEYQLLASDGLQGLQGMDGTDGIPGTPGKDGATTYFHIKYSAVANPTAAQMSETPNVFIGTYVDFTKEDSNDPAKYTWARFQGLQGAKGEQGVPGIGVDGKTYYLHIKYSNDGGKTFTGNNGEDTGKYIGVFTDLNQNDSNTPSDYKWSLIKGEQGDKGDSVSNVGNWKTGLIVPYLGITRMGGKSWMCKVKAGTTSPPMWTVTDKSGNRILQTQDGGKTYGYILTGGVNTTEYELVAADGDPGKDGQDGEKGDPGKDGEKGEQGIQGCILRHSEWKAGVEYRNDEGQASGTRYLDVALVRDDSMATGWRAYKCKTTHTSAAGNAPGNGTYWEEFGLNVTSIFASLIIAKDASLDFMQGNQLLIKKSDGTVTAGLSGSQAGSKVRIWAGSATPDNAPFRVLESGKMIGTDVELSGNLISGSIGSFNINKGISNISDNPDAFIEIAKNGGRFFRVNSAKDSEMCAIRGDKTTALSVSVYGDHSMGIKVKAQAGIESKAIESYGDVSLEAREGEVIRIAGLHVGTKEITTSYTVKSNDDFLFCKNTSAITITLDSSFEHGKVLYIKRIGSGSVTLSGSIIAQNSTTTTTKYNVSDGPLMLVYHWMYWIVFYCG